MSAPISPSSFNRVAQFGTSKQVTNPATGGKTTHFVQQFSLHYAPKTRTLNQTYALSGSTLMDSKVIIIRHNQKVIADMLVQLPDGLYKIISNSVDDSNQLNTYDYLTIQLTEKGGK
ncbi:phage head closure protein [Furfurilactobacillus milii]|uniref:Phage head closure protein n=1 Tax=Furfurilactobacillus rossiae TaxID=231049 RepID=A0A7C9MIK4_9LACO|nr:phage head closure protein [Furfurilactobacillus milii]MYV04445.1 phage head closure protein [Furfurilactobacillus milii]